MTTKSKAASSGCPPRSRSRNIVRCTRTRREWAGDESFLDSLTKIPMIGVFEKLSADGYTLTLGELEFANQKKPRD
jgi:hypothetical protein